VNVYYGYYRSWHDVAVGVGGVHAPSVTADLKALEAQQRLAPHMKTAGSVDLSVGRTGRIFSVELPGARSGINRRGYIYLPAVYDPKNPASAVLPVVELFHGSPGEPSDWIAGLHVQTVLNTLITNHEIQPMIVVLADTNGGRAHRPEECTNAIGGPQDDTYLADDVPGDVRSALHLTPTRWAAMGYSSGGYCAVNFTPTDGGYASSLFHGDVTAETANNPLSMVQTAPQIPDFVLAAGSGDHESLGYTTRFASALGKRAHPVLLIQKRAGHNYPAWQAALPATFRAVSHDLPATIFPQPTVHSRLAPILVPTVTR
jgi:hypothetical protein